MALYGGIAFICIVVGIFIAYGIYKLLENNWLMIIYKMK
jgi:hypothetical protein